MKRKKLIYGKYERIVVRLFRNRNGANEFIQKWEFDTFKSAKEFAKDLIKYGELGISSTSRTEIVEHDYIGSRFYTVTDYGKANQ